MLSPGYKTRKDGYKYPSRYLGCKSAGWASLRGGRRLPVAGAQSRSVPAVGLGGWESPGGCGSRAGPFLRRGGCRPARDVKGMALGFGLALLLKSSIAVFNFPWEGGRGESSRSTGSSGRCLPSRHGAGTKGQILAKAIRTSDFGNPQIPPSLPGVQALRPSGNQTPLEHPPNYQLLWGAALPPLHPAGQEHHFGAKPPQDLTLTQTTPAQGPPSRRNARADAPWGPKVPVGGALPTPGTAITPWEGPRRVGWDATAAAQTRG